MQNQINQETEYRVDELKSPEQYDVTNNLKSSISILGQKRKMLVISVFFLILAASIALLLYLNGYLFGNNVKDTSDYYSNDLVLPSMEENNTGFVDNLESDKLSIVPSQEENKKIMDSNTKEYHSPEGLFSFRYSTIFSLLECKDGIQLYRSGDPQPNCTHPPSGVMTLWYENEPVTQYYSSSDEYSTEKNEVIIDGYIGEKHISTKKESHQDSPEANWISVVYFSKGSKHFMLSLLDQELQHEFDTVLNSFRFSKDEAQFQRKKMTYTFEGFSIDYDPEWMLLDMATAEDFPLKTRLEPISSIQKAVALTHNGINFVILIEKESNGQSSGIFINDAEFDKYQSDRVKFTISNDTFYLLKDFPDTSALLSSHTGPYGWSSVSKFVPNKSTNSEGSVDGFEDVIKVNGKQYVLIVSTDTGRTIEDKEYQGILGMLESIRW